MIWLLLSFGFQTHVSRAVAVDARCGLIRHGSGSPARGPQTASAINASTIHHRVWAGIWAGKQSTSGSAED